MELPAQLAKASLELVLRNRQLPRQAEEGEIVAVPAERQDATALRAEVLVNRSTGAAASAFQCRDRLRRNRIQESLDIGGLPARHAPGAAATAGLLRVRIVKDEAWVRSCRMSVALQEQMALRSMKILAPLPSKTSSPNRAALPGRT
jgi:hypothetical protein